MWIKLLMNKWVLGGLALAGIAGAAFIYGRDSGIASGFDRAYEQFQADIEATQEAWAESIEQRDTDWNEQISNQINELNESIAQNQEDSKRQDELLKRLRVIETRFEDVFNEIQTSDDLGSCNLGPEFDRLLDSITSPSARPADGPSGGPGDSTDSETEAQPFSGLLWSVPPANPVLFIA